MGKELDRFIEIVSRLRASDGCAWDREQTHRSLLSSLLEECYEFFEAVESGDWEKMRDELGDVLLQVALHAQIAKDKGAFDIEDVARAIADKIVRRHPHVFGNTSVDLPEELMQTWDAIKNSESAHRQRTSILDGIPKVLPALLRAEKVQRRAARVGFDWNDLESVLDKVEEEIVEFRSAVAQGNRHCIADELGDILFSLVNVARHFSICAEDNLRITIDKFTRRFRYVEQKYRNSGRSIQQATLEEMDRYWEESKDVVG